MLVRNATTANAVGLTDQKQVEGASFAQAPSSFKRPSDTRRMFRPQGAFQDQQISEGGIPCEQQQTQILAHH